MHASVVHPPAGWGLGCAGADWVGAKSWARVHVRRRVLIRGAGTVRTPRSPAAAARDDFAGFIIILRSVPDRWNIPAPPLGACADENDGEGGGATSEKVLRTPRRLCT